MKKRLTRREAIAIMGAAGSAVAFGCSTDSVTSPSSGTSTTTPTTGGSAACAVTPNETVGPYPSRADIFRSDIREDRAGTPLTLNLKVANANASCAPVANANVEIWHADVAGDYSEYGTQTAATWLRGVQTTNANGRRDVHDDLSRLVPGPGDAHPHRGHDQRPLGEGDADCVPRVDQQHRVRAGRLRATRQQPDVQYGRMGSSPTACRRSWITPSGSPSSGYTASYQINISV